MGPGEVAKLLNLDRTTITKWTSNEYKRYMTPGAQGGTGKSRVLTERDLRVLFLLKTLKASNTPIEEIHTTLQQMERNDWQGLPDLPDAPPGVAEFPIMPVATADAALTIERRALLREVANLQDTVRELKGELADERTRDRADREALLRELGDVRADLAQTKTLLDLYEQGRLKPKGE